VLSILQASERIRNREISPVELTQQCLERIEQLNPELNAFITVTADSAMAEVRKAEQEIAGGRWRGPLHGIPVGLKDLFDTAGVKTTAASALFADRVPKQDAEVVKRLKNAGAIILGKQNLHEFAYGGSSMISHYGPVRNARNPEHIAGGSSGGSATSLAARMCYAALGTDTAGSIREPAALCGVVGLKPTFGRVSTQGVLPLSESLDHVGPIAATVADCALLLKAISDPATPEIELPENLNCALRIGIPRSYFFEDLDADVAQTIEQALRVLESIGCMMVGLTLSVPTDRKLQSAESWAYHRALVARSPELYQPETLRRLRSGENISEQEIAQSRAELRQSREEINQVFEKVDLIVTPTTPIPAPKISDLTRNPALLRPRELVLLRNTRPFNIWGLPAISVPCGHTKGGLPIGLQIAGPHWGENIVLQAAYAFEQLLPQPT
jgi:aspartyl-tRNA(Asn)/glutamyl-tRNA(Gln) amidotransferase subunit A